MAKWNIDKSHTDASFSVKHMGIMNVRGSFKEVKGQVELDETNAIKGVETTINIGSIVTRDKDRDEHLLSEDFFDAGKYPEMKFKSTSINKISESSYEIVGDLTLKGVTKSVTLDVVVGKEIKDPFGLRRIAIEGYCNIDRKDFGMKWNQVLDNGGLLVGETVKITIDSEIVTE